MQAIEGFGRGPACYVLIVLIGPMCNGAGRTCMQRTPRFGITNHGVDDLNYDEGNEDPRPAERVSGAENALHRAFSHPAIECNTHDSILSFSGNVFAVRLDR